MYIHVCMYVHMCIYIYIYIYIHKLNDLCAMSRAGRPSGAADGTTSRETATSPPLVVVVVVVVVVVPKGSPEEFPEDRLQEVSVSSHTPNLPANIIPTNIARLKLSGYFPKDMRIPPL